MQRTGIRRAGGQDSQENNKRFTSRGIAAGEHTSWAKFKATFPQRFLCVERFLSGWPRPFPRRKSLAISLQRGSDFHAKSHVCCCRPLDGHRMSLETGHLQPSRERRDAGDAGVMQSSGSI